MIGRRGSFAGTVVSVATLGACAGAPVTPGVAAHEEVSPGPAPARADARPPLNRPFSLPRAELEGQSESGLLVLRPPRDPSPALLAMEAFFHAVAAESVPELGKVLSGGARTRSSSSARPEPALLAWQRRFERLDYSSLAGRIVFRPSAVELFTETDARVLSTRRALPVLPRGEEVLLRVPLGSATSGLFGQEIGALLRLEPGGYKIGELFEDFRLP